MAAARVACHLAAKLGLQTITECASSRSRAHASAPLRPCAHAPLRPCAQDLGYYDTGIHNREAATWTQNITALADAGIRLMNHYTHWHCSPTRRSFLTGRCAVPPSQTNPAPAAPPRSRTHANSQLRRARAAAAAARSG